MRRFLRRVGDGGGQLALTPHHSVQTDGTSYLAAANTGTRFQFPAIASGLVTTVACWVQIHSKVGFQRIWQVGDGVVAATIVAGLQYNPTADRFESYMSTGAVFTALDSGFSPALDTWYLLTCGFTENALGMTNWDLTHQIESISVGLIQPGYNPIASPRLGLFASPDGGNLLAGGKLDSFGFWSRASLPGLTPLWNNGQALDFGAVPAPFNTGGSLWADFNEASGSTSYRDATGTGNLSVTGGGLTRQAGAGF
jgi:hypothetical protein